MDPTMGQAVITGQATFGGEEEEIFHQPIQPGMSAYLSVADMQADQAGGTEASGVVATDAIVAEVEQPVAEVAPPAPSAPAVIYPAGRAVDFNKPFQVFDANDDEVIHEDARIIAVLSGNSYPVVVVSRHDGEQVVSQFDTDGDEMEGELKVENIVTEPVIKYGVLIKQGRGYSLSSDLFKSESDAYAGTSVDYNESIALVFPITIPVPGSAPLNDVSGLPEGGIETEENDDDDNVEQLAEHSHPDAKWVNGRLIKPGDKVQARKTGESFERVCTVIKTRDDHQRTLYIQADEGGTGPYWALNKKVRPHY